MSKTTELRHPSSDNLDVMSIYEILELINSEDESIPVIIKKHLKDIEHIINIIINGFSNNGRLFYIGCGTSGRFGILDASECPPTFKVNPLLVQGIIAGGNEAVFKSIEGAEDSFNDGYDILKSKKITKNDTVIGISASGTAQFVLGSLKYANNLGAYTTLLTFNNIKSERFIKKILKVIVGPEIITGSTRMKAGTATKMILNMISTISLIKSNRIYKNYMVDLKVSNMKLKNRAIFIIKDICKISQHEAESLLSNAKNDVKVAIVMFCLNISREKAKNEILNVKGNLRKIIL